MTGWHWETGGFPPLPFTITTPRTRPDGTPAAADGTETGNPPLRWHA